MENYKIAVNMLIETLEFHMDGYEMALYDDELEEWAEVIMKSVEQRIKIVRKFQELIVSDK